MMLDQLLEDRPLFIAHDMSRLVLMDAIREPPASFDTYHPFVANVMKLAFMATSIGHAYRVVYTMRRGGEL